MTFTGRYALMYKVVVHLSTLSLVQTRDNGYHPVSPIENDAAVSSLYS